MARKKTHEEYVKELNEKGIQVEPLEPYVNIRTKIPHLWRCGHVTEIKPSNVLSGQGCGRCAKEQRLEQFAKGRAKGRAKACEKKLLKAAKELDQRVKEVHGTKVRRDLSTPYITDKTKILWLCEKGHQWEAKPSNIKQGSGCPTCGAEKPAQAAARMSKLAVIGAYSQLDGRGIQHLPNKDNPRGFPHSMTSKEKWKCMECSCVWETSISNITSHGTSCPECAKGKLKGEIYTRELLEEYGIEFQSQKKFADLKRINPLSYDFFIPSMDILIECQGEQHYKPVEFMGGVEKFALQQERDQLKREYAWQNGYYLLEISYKDYRKDRIKAILEDAGVLQKQPA